MASARAPLRRFSSAAKRFLAQQIVQRADLGAMASGAGAPDLDYTDPSFDQERARAAATEPFDTPAVGAAAFLSGADGELLNTPTVDADAWDRPTSDAEGFSGHVLTEGSLRTSLDVSAFPRSGGVDPFELVEGDMRGLAEDIKDILGVDHPVLSTVAKYFFEMDGGKKLRPTMVMLVSRAANAHMRASDPARSDEAAPEAVPRSEPLTAPQKRLAEITEMIHTASLLHDDVIDMADVRRGVGSVNRVFGNKLAVLAGDFLLARASVCLARLRNVEVIELLSTVIEHLVRGEVMQMQAAFRDQNALDTAFNMYMRKTYYKTASLMANSCKAAALLAGHPPAVCESVFLYGKHVGLAFQLVDDMLDFEGTLESLGKPALNDLRQGLTTAPVLFATQNHPAMIKLIKRKFEAPGDVEQACEMVTSSNGLEKTRSLALGHAQMALDAVAHFKPSPERDALAAVVKRVVSRKY